jgi:hypothetical protein
MSKIDKKNSMKDKTDEQIQAILKDYVNVFSNTL